MVSRGDHVGRASLLQKEMSVLKPLIRLELRTMQLDHVINRTKIPKTENPNERRLAVYEIDNIVTERNPSIHGSLQQSVCMIYILLHAQWSVI